jgi:hypothetical protein
MKRLLHLLTVCGLRGEEEMFRHEAPLALDTIRSHLLQALVIGFETILYQVTCCNHSNPRSIAMLIDSSGESPTLWMPLVVLCTGGE